MEICDLINGSEEGPKDAVKAIRKRFNLNAGKNHSIIVYTLMVSKCISNSITDILQSMFAFQDFRDLCKKLWETLPPLGLQ